MSRYDESENERRIRFAQLDGTMFANLGSQPTINLNATDSSLTVATQGEPKDARSLGNMFDARRPDPQWKRILRALAERPAMGFTRHELADLFTDPPIPLSSVCRVVGEKLLPFGLAEVSTLITRESKYHADNGVLFITPKGRKALSQERAA